MKISLDFDNMDFMQFMWYYDRLKKQKEKENSKEVNLADNLEQLKQLGRITHGR